MKVPLAVVLAVLTAAVSAAACSPFLQQPGSGAPMTQPADASSQQPGSLQSCPPSKDTCEVAPEAEQPAAAPTSKADQEQHSTPARTAGTHSSKKPQGRKRIKKQAAAQDPSRPKKIVVRQGGTSDAAAVLTPGATAKGSFSPQITADLLSATDANLREATSKPLTPTQEETVNQIKMFMEQANAAVKAGDLDRGHNLAIKAHLLSDDLVKH